MASTWSDSRQQSRITIGVGFAPFVPWLATAGVITFALLLGGGTRQGLWSDALVQLLALGLIALSAPAFGYYRTPRAAIPLLLMAAIVALPLLQLIPLPPSLWVTLPGHAMFTAVFQVADQSAPWLPVSLDPSSTFRSVLSLIVPIAVFLATLRLGYRARRSLSLLFIAVGLISVVLGLGQLMQGEGSPLRFFPITNTGDSVGFFANRNHYAALLYCLIPLTAAWLLALLDGRLRERWLPVAACVLVYVALLVGLAMARSRAGFFLAMAAAVASLLLAGLNRGKIAKRGVAAIGIALLIGAVAAVQFAFFGIAGRLDSDVLTDFRFAIDAITATAAHAFYPFGSGIGTFVSVYQMFETPNALITSYVNHAHNDWLELWLEGSCAAAVIAAAFLVWFVSVTVRIWRSRLPNSAPIDSNLARAATIALLALLVHSLVDYPLRTTALMTLFAFYAALLVEPIVVPQAVPWLRSRELMHDWQKVFRRRRRPKNWRATGVRAA